MAVDKKTFILLLVGLWALGWTSMPGVDGAHSLTSVDSQAHKLVAKLIILITVFAYYSISSVGWNRLINDGKHFLLFFLLNIIILPLSANFFYSFTRLIDYFLMIATTHIIASRLSRNADIESVVTYFFSVLTIYILAALVIYIVYPEWGAIGDGIDQTTQELKLRLGGTFIRVDAAAALGGVCFSFWLFEILRCKGQAGILKYLGLTISLLVVVFAYSRSVLIATTVSCVFALLRSRKIKHLKYLLVMALFLAGVFHEQVLSYYFRNESLENVQSASGRLFVTMTLFQINSWFNITFGNGYLMHSPQGLYFPVDELLQDMSSAHNGYLSALFGSGILGLLLCVFIHGRLYFNISHVQKTVPAGMSDWLLPVFLLLSISTFFDYGIWGTSSPSLMVFSLMFFIAMRLKALNSKLTS